MIVDMEQKKTYIWNVISLNKAAKSFGIYVIVNVIWLFLDYTAVRWYCS